MNRMSNTIEVCIKGTRCLDEIVEIRNNETGCLHPPDDAVYF